MPLTDEYQTDPVQSKGFTFQCLEHARWAALWDNLYLEWGYRTKQISFEKASIGVYKPHPSVTTYRAPFFVQGLGAYVDVREGWPRPETLERAGWLAHLTGYEVVIFRGPMFVPHGREYPFSVPAKIIRGRNQITQDDVFLTDEGRDIQMKFGKMPMGVATGRLVRAFESSLEVQVQSLAAEPHEASGVEKPRSDVVAEQSPSKAIFCTMSGR